MGSVTEALATRGPDPLEEELARHWPRLRGHLARPERRVPGLEPEDLAQEVAARALRHRARFDGARGLWPWLWRIAQRVLVDQRSASARRRAREVELAEEPAAAEASVGDPRGELERLLAQLTAPEREILVRFHAREESVAEIARALALPQGTVKSHLSRARRKLAELEPDKETSHEG